MVRKFGRQNGLQRYHCRAGNHYFQSKRGSDDGPSGLWRSYIFKRQTVGDLAEATGLSTRQVRRRLEAAAIPKTQPIDASEPTVVIMDTTYFGNFGVMVFRCPHRRRNLLWRFVRHETNEAYLAGVGELEARGFRIVGAVCDGKRWLCDALSRRFPTQHCQFHLMKTVTRYLTSRPVLLPGIALRAISMTIARTDERTFTAALNAWHGRWKDFLKEKSADPWSGRWHYVHRRIRGAYAAIKRALPYLFTCEHYREFQIPNTTNSLDGIFTHLKQKIRVHRGLNEGSVKKMIETILAEPSN